MQWLDYRVAKRLPLLLLGCLLFSYDIGMLKIRESLLNQIKIVFLTHKPFYDCTNLLFKVFREERTRKLGIL